MSPAERSAAQSLRVAAERALPTWLKNVHAKLDAAVFAAYGWNTGISDDELLAKLLALNLEQASDMKC